MAFPDFPFDPSLPSFLHHSDVLAYLESYADHFCVREHIRVSGGARRSRNAWGSPLPAPQRRSLSTELGPGWQDTAP